MSENVVVFRPAQSERHTSGNAHCLACKHEWVAVLTQSAESYDADLECPECHTRRGQFIWPFQGPQAEEVWTCKCGGTCFMITRPGTRCVNCGRHQVFDG